LDGKSFFLALFNSHLSTWLGFDASGLILGFPFLPSMIDRRPYGFFYPTNSKKFPEII